MKQNISTEASQFTVLVLGSKSVLNLIKTMLIDQVGVEVLPFSASNPAPKPPQLEPATLLVCETAENMGDVDSTELPHIRTNHPDVPIIAITNHPNHADAIRLIKSGYAGYFALPSEQRKLYEAIAAEIDRWRAQQRKKSFADLAALTFDFSKIIGKSPQIRRTLQLAEKAIQSDFLTVLILGETGTGKELLAKAIHYNSNNRELPFVEIGCSAIPENLLESELFGYEKGAFTDARERKTGLFEVAAGGTIFLDEIGDISPVIQSKILKVIEEKKVRRLGSVKDISVEARIIAATSKNLEAMVAAGTFRKDLYYRLNVLPITLPSLRERREDIPILATNFLQYYAKFYDKRIEGFSDETLRLIAKHTWEGNIRELKHKIERAVVLTEGRRLQVFDFDILDASAESEMRPLETARIEFAADGNEQSLQIQIELGDTSLSKIEKLVLKQVLLRVGGNKSRAAKILGISRPRLDRVVSQDPDYFKSVL